MCVNFKKSDNICQMYVVVLESFKMAGGLAVFAFSVIYCVCVCVWEEYIHIFNYVIKYPFKNR